MIYKLVVVLLLSISVMGCTTNTSNSQLVTVATKYNGLHERKHRKQIQGLIGVSPTRYPWCGYFAAAVVKKAGKTPPKNYPRARAWMKYGKAVKKSDIRKGDIIVLGNHVAIVTRVEGKRIHHISGNYSNKVGYGVYNLSRIEAIRR